MCLCLTVCLVCVRFGGVGIRNRLRGNWTAGWENGGGGGAKTGRGGGEARQLQQQQQQQQPVA